MRPAYPHVITIKKDDEWLLQKLKAKNVKVVEMLRRGIKEIAIEKGIIRVEGDSLKSKPENISLTNP